MTTEKEIQRLSKLVKTFEKEQIALIATLTKQSEVFSDGPIMIFD